MSKSAILKSSLAKKYWMALTGLFLCLFLVGHLAGNLQLLIGFDLNSSVPQEKYGAILQFNDYAYFMTHNPLVKILSYVTYFSILFHAIDGIMLTVQNRAARKKRYAHNKPSANSSFSSRNMAVLGTLILAFIIMHMMNFWAEMHWGGIGEYQAALASGDIAAGAEGANYIMHRNLYEVVLRFFVTDGNALIFTLIYVVGMAALAFHLWHGFSAAFQSLGLRYGAYKNLITGAGKAFAILIPLAFAAIPLYLHFAFDAADVDQLLRDFNDTYNVAAPEQA